MSCLVVTVLVSTEAKHFQENHHKARGEVFCGVLFVVLLGSGKSFKHLISHTRSSQLVGLSQILEEKVQMRLDTVLEADLWLLYPWSRTKVSFRNLPYVPYVLNPVALKLVTQLPARAICNMDKLDYFWGNLSLQNPGWNRATEKHLKTCYCVRETWGPDSLQDCMFLWPLNCTKPLIAHLSDSLSS